MFFGLKGHDKKAQGIAGIALGVEFNVRSKALKGNAVKHFEA
jgi:hypothetical protein